MSEKPLLGLCMIVKDEAASIRRVLESFKPHVDYWTILDTGSTDGTQEIVRDGLAGIPGQLVEEPFVDFATSRNRALELHGVATTFTIMPNGDTLVDGAKLRDFLEVRRTVGANAYNLRITPGHYSLPLVLRAGSGWRYMWRTHEIPMGSGAGGTIPDVTLIRDRSARTSEQWRSRWERDRALLGLHLDEDPNDARAWFYLAQTHECLGDYRAARDAYATRAKLGGYFDETFEARLRYAHMLVKLDTAQGLISTAYLDAYAFDPRRAEALYGLADYWHRRDNHALAFLFARRAAELPLPTCDFFIDDDVYTWKAADLAAVHGYYLGDAAAKAAGLKLSEQCVRARAGDERIRANWTFYAPSATELFDGYRSKPIGFVPEQPWSASNPSVFYDGAALRCIVRTVNYKIIDGQYRMPPDDPAIRTRNFMLDLDDDLAVTRVTEMIDKTGIPRSSYPVHGFEDCRLFRHDGVLCFTATVCDFDLDRADEGPREIVFGRLDDDYSIMTVHPLRGPWSGLTQKNWMPRSGDGIDRCASLIYALSPNGKNQATVLDLITGPFTDPLAFVTKPASLDHGRLRGGSQLVRVPEGWLCVVHDVSFPGNSRIYSHRFVLLTGDHKIVSMTDPFYFEQRGIEFCAGLARCGNRLIVSFGVEDRRACLGIFDLDVVMTKLRADFVI